MDLYRHLILQVCILASSPVDELIVRLGYLKRIIQDRYNLLKIRLLGLAILSLSLHGYFCTIGHLRWLHRQNYTSHLSPTQVVTQRPPTLSIHSLGLSDTTYEPRYGIQASYAPSKLRSNWREFTTEDVLDDSQLPLPVSEFEMGTLYEIQKNYTIRFLLLYQSTWLQIRNVGERPYIGSSHGRSKLTLSKTWPWKCRLKIRSYICRETFSKK